MSSLRRQGPRIIIKGLDSRLHGNDSGIGGLKGAKPSFYLKGRRAGIDKKTGWGDKRVKESFDALEWLLVGKDELE
jgi:hypothetical protein